MFAKAVPEMDVRKDSQKSEIRIAHLYSVTWRAEQAAVRYTEYRDQNVVY